MRYESNRCSPSELYHYGVKGMKWGVRKFQQKSQELDAKKVAYKKAKKAYSKSFDKAHARAIGAYSPIKKHRQNAEKRWKDAATKAKQLEAAEKEYKTAKKEFNKNTTVGQKIGRGVSAVSKVLTRVAKDTMTVGQVSERNKHAVDAAQSVLKGDFGSAAISSVYANAANERAKAWSRS